MMMMMMEEHCKDINDYYCLDKDDEFDENIVEEYEMVFDDMNVVHNNQQLAIEQYRMKWKMSQLEH